MAKFDFLQDEEIGVLIARLATDAAQVLAPEEAYLADLIAEEYLEQVSKADTLLYPGRSRDLSLGVGDPELLLLVILPVLTGFVANLFSMFSVWTVHHLRERLVHHPARDTKPTALPPTQVRELLEAQARLAGLSNAQIEQLAKLIGARLTEVLMAGQPEGDSR